MQCFHFLWQFLICFIFLFVGSTRPGSVYWPLCYIHIWKKSGGSQTEKFKNLWIFWNQKSILSVSCQNCECVLLNFHGISHWPDFYFSGYGCFQLFVLCNMKYPQDRCTSSFWEKGKERGGYGVGWKEMYVRGCTQWSENCPWGVCNRLQDVTFN